MRAPIPILTYHQIGVAPPKGTPFRSLTVSANAFARQMRSLTVLGYQGLSMSALQPYLNGEKAGKVVGITFDDGYLNNLEHALPVLQAQGFSATCYVPSGLVGQSNVWDAARGVPAAPLMNASQLRAWVQAGQEIGAHGCTHADLTQLPAARAQAEIADSRAALEQLVGTPVRHFCYPYGRYQPAHVVMVEQAGYASATTVRRGRAMAGAPGLELPRVPVLRSTHLLLFALKLATRYEDRRA